VDPGPNALIRKGRKALKGSGGSKKLEAPVWDSYNGFPVLMPPAVASKPAVGGGAGSGPGSSSYRCDAEEADRDR
jgi:hypothetical protein